MGDPVTPDPLSVRCPACGAKPGHDCLDLRRHPNWPSTIHKCHLERYQAVNGPARPTLGIREAARRLGLHENTIRNMIGDGRLTDVRVPGTGWARIDVQQVEELEDGRGTNYGERDA